MSKIDESVMTRASIKGLEALSQLLESDPETIAAMPLEDIEEELRVMNLEETIEQGERSKDQDRHPTARENSSEETIKRMRSFNERSAKFREILRVIRETYSR